MAEIPGWPHKALWFHSRFIQIRAPVKFCSSNPLGIMPHCLSGASDSSYLNSPDIGRKPESERYREEAIEPRSFQVNARPGPTPRPLPTTPHRGPGTAAARPAGVLGRHRPPDPLEAPRLLVAGLARIALEHLSVGANPEHQLALVNQLVGLLQSHAPCAISAGDLLHPSARLFSEIRSTALLPSQAETIRPIILLADSTL